MFQNRITHHLHRIDGDRALAAARSATTMAVASGGSQAMVMVPCTTSQVHWQAHLYRLAYERARAQLAPPRHDTRYFSVWN